MWGWIGWITKGLWRRRRGVLVTVVISVVLGVVFALQQYEPRPPRTMSDPQFVAAANALCTQKVRPLAEQRRSSGEGGSDSPRANARKIDRVADKLEAAVAELRALEHRPANNGEIDAWLAEFDAYIAAGRRYADALRSGDEAIYTKADDAAVEPLEAISRFARANLIDACIP